MTSEDKNDVALYVRTALSGCLMRHLMEIDKACVRQYMLNDFARVLMVVFFKQKAVGAVYMGPVKDRGAQIVHLEDHLILPAMKQFIADGAECTILSKPEALH